MAKIFNSIFGGGKPDITTGPTQYSQTPQFIQDALQNLLQQGSNVAGQTSPFAPPPTNAFTQNALNMVNAGAPAAGFMQGASSAFGQSSNLLNNVPGQVGLSNGYLNAASGNIAQGTNPITAQQIGDQATQLMSPYTSNVIDSLKAAFGDNLNSSLSANNSNSTLAGAFGSDRAALENGQTRLANDRAFGEQSGSLLNNAYQTAATNAQQNLQNERSNFLTAAGLNIGQSSNALGGANAYTSAANSANNLGQANLQGSAQNISNYNNAINQNTNAGNYLNNYAKQQNQVPLQQLQLLQSLISSFSPFAGAGASQSYQPQGLLQQLGLTSQSGINAGGSGGTGGQPNGNAAALPAIMAML